MVGVCIHREVCNITFEVRAAAYVSGTLVSPTLEMDLTVFRLLLLRISWARNRGDKQDPQCYPPNYFVYSVPQFPASPESNKKRTGFQRVGKLSLCASQKLTRKLDFILRNN